MSFFTVQSIPPCLLPLYSPPFPISSSTVQSLPPSIFFHCTLRPSLYLFPLYSSSLPSCVFFYCTLHPSIYLFPLYSSSRRVFPPTVQSIPPCVFFHLYSPSLYVFFSTVHSFPPCISVYLYPLRAMMSVIEFTNILCFVYFLIDYK